MPIEHFFILIALGTAAGFLNAIAGGGSILTVPAFIFLGLDGATANGSNRIAVIVQSFSAILSFRREKMAAFRQSARYAIFTLPGGILGALIAVNLKDETFKIILSVLMILIVMTLFIPLKKRSNNSEARKIKSWWIYPSLLGIGLYGGFLQIGVGFLIMAALYHIERLDLVEVNMHKVFMMLFFTLPAFLVFLYSGNINWMYGLVLSLGNALGAWWGAKVSVRGGEKAIRIMVALAALIMALKLLQTM